MSNPLAAFGIDINLAGVETGMPILVTGHYPVEVDEVSVEDSKNTPGNRNLLVKMKLAGPATSIQGQKEGRTNDVKAGFPLRLYLPLQQSEKPDAPDYRKRIAEFQDAVEGTDVKTRNPEFNPFDYKGKIFVVQVAVDNDPEFGMTNNIKKLSKMTA